MNRGSRGGFFQVEACTFHEVVRLGMNPAVAYLVLSRFRNPKTSETRAGVHAVENYTGIGRTRAGRALDSLREKGFIEPAPSGSRIVVKCSLTGRRQRARPGGKKAEFSTHTAPPLEHWIHLPNEIVDGAADETAPLELLRQMGDAMTLRLFLDLYREQLLPEDFGISRSVIFQPCTMTKVWEVGALNFWAYKGALTHCDVDSRAVNPHGRDFWARFGSLHQVGLILRIPVLFESAGSEAVPIYPFAESGTSTERRLRDVLADYVEGQMESSGERGRILRAKAEAIEHEGIIPVPMHYPSPSVVGIYRLRYLPSTSMTAAWHARIERFCKPAFDRFESSDLRSKNAASRG